MCRLDRRLTWMSAVVSVLETAFKPLRLVSVQQTHPFQNDNQITIKDSLQLRQGAYVEFLVPSLEFA